MTRPIRSRRSIAAAGLTLLAGCTASPRRPDPERPPATLPAAESLIGTWRLVSMSKPDGATVFANGPFFMRFYADGTCASWPTPVAPISRGQYKLADGLFTLPDAPASRAAQMRLTDAKLWYWSDDYECLYYRVTPDLEPGRLP